MEEKTAPNRQRGRVNSMDGDGVVSIASGSRMSWTKVDNLNVVTASGEHPKLGLGLQLPSSPVGRIRAEHQDPERYAGGVSRHVSTPVVNGTVGGQHDEGDSRRRSRLERSGPPSNDESRILGWPHEFEDLRALRTGRSRCHNDECGSRRSPGR